LKAVEALRDHGAQVKGMLAIFTYGFHIAEENFEKANLDLHTLSDYQNLIEKATQSNYTTEKEAETLAAWRENPSQWP